MGELEQQVLELELEVREAPPPPAAQILAQHTGCWFSERRKTNIYPPHAEPQAPHGERCAETAQQRPADREPGAEGATGPPHAGQQGQRKTPGHCPRGGWRCSGGASDICCVSPQVQVLVSAGGEAGLVGIGSSESAELRLRVPLQQVQAQIPLNLKTSQWIQMVLMLQTMR